MYLLRYVAFLLLAACAPLALAQSPPPYQSQINVLADRLAHNVHSAHLKHHQSPKVLVTDFVNDQGRPNLLGQQVSDALSEALSTRLSAGHLIPRKQFQDKLLAAGLSPTDIKDSDALQWQAAEAGANLLITGRLSAPNGSTSTLHLDLTNLPDAKDLSSTSADLTMPLDGAKFLAYPEDWPAPKADSLCTPIENHRNSAGTSPPQCLRCPPPSYSEAARKRKLQGKVILRVQIDEQGRATSAVVLSGAPYGLADQAVKAVLQWQFRPATKDNQPIATCTPVEVVFRLY
jgi:TonB family protein